MSSIENESKRISGRYCSSLVPYLRWLREMDLSEFTGIRYRRKGWIQTVSIGGKLYITQESLDKFEADAKCGKFERKGGTRSKNAEGAE